MPETQVLVAMCGIPFSGKTTVARELSERCGLALVSVDAIVRDLGIDLGPDAVEHRGWARAMAEGFARARCLLAEGQSVVYDHANHTRRNRDRCRRVESGAGAGFRLVWLDTSVEEARRRLLENRETLARNDVPDASFCEIVAQFESPAGEPDVIRVTPGMTIDEVIIDLA